MKENRFTVRDVVAMTGLSERTIRRYLRDGKLSGTKLGGVWRFNKADIEAMFVRRELDHDITTKTGDAIHRFIRGEHEHIAPIQACLIVDVNGVNNRAFDAVKQAVEYVVKAHEGIKAKLIPTRDAVRITVIGHLDQIDTFTNALKRINHH